MWFMIFAFRMWHNLRPGRATRGKWRIPDGKVESDLFSYSELQSGIPRLCQLRIASVEP
jgi:hypothetical protein